jgi:PEP-CTERM putative exosortase interaction domain
MISPKFFAIALCLACCLMIPTFSSASSGTDFSNSLGTLTGTNAGLTLSGSTLVAITGYMGNPQITGDLGTVEFTTGALTSGDLQMGATFAAGGTFTITGNGTDGLTGTLFTGTFSGPVSWDVLPLGNGTYNYTLMGVVSGTMGTTAVSGVTVQLTVTSAEHFNGSTQIAGGDTTVTPSVPEPSTLAMLGTGVLSLAGIVRRKFRA